MPTILITGARGMLAENLENMLKSHYQLKFLTRNPKKNNEFRWDIESDYIDEKAFEDVEHIIHLAGASIGEKRWTPERKKEILNSRVQSARLILKYIERGNIHLTSYLSASAVGYYGTVTTGDTFTETSPLGSDFLSEVCKQWEDTADAFSFVADRIIKLRFGVIISAKGGALQKMLTPARLNLNTLLGNGNQIIPWIDIDDISQMIRFCVENDTICGVYNAVSPKPVTNKQFTYLLAKILGKKVFLPAVPKWMVKCIFGEPSVLLLEGNKVSAQKILNEGFTFQYPYLEKCLKKEVKR